MSPTFPVWCCQDHVFSLCSGHLAPATHRVRAGPFGYRARRARRARTEPMDAPAGGAARRAAPDARGARGARGAGSDAPGGPWGPSVVGGSVAHGSSQG